MSKPRYFGGLAVERLAGQQVVIGDTLVQVVSLGRGRVRLRIVAPRDTKIMRAELLPEGWENQFQIAASSQAVGA